MCYLRCEVFVYVINLDIKLSSTSSFWKEVDVTIVKLVIAVNTAACDNDNEVECNEETFRTLLPHSLCWTLSYIMFCFSLTGGIAPASLEKKHRNRWCFWKVNCDIYIEILPLCIMSTFLFIHVLICFHTFMSRLFSALRLSNFHVKKKKNHNNTLTG